MVQDKIDEWEKGLDEYISQVESDCEQYAYTRKNAWRKTVPDGKKHGWHEWHKDNDTLDLNVNDFDDKIYTFCGVAFPHTVRPYSYRTEDPTIKIGDEVLVPVGDKKTIGTVVSVGQYMRIAAPYPVDKTEFIIGKINKEITYKTTEGL